MLSKSISVEPPTHSAGKRLTAQSRHRPRPPRKRARVARRANRVRRKAVRCRRSGGWVCVSMLRFQENFADLDYTVCVVSLS